jgi:hypothetical protein
MYRDFNWGVYCCGRSEGLVKDAHKTFSLAQNLFDQQLTSYLHVFHYEATLSNNLSFLFRLNPPIVDTDHPCCSEFPSI